MRRDGVGVGAGDDDDWQEGRSTGRLPLFKEFSRTVDALMIDYKLLIQTSIKITPYLNNLSYKITNESQSPHYQSYKIHQPNN